MRQRSNKDAIENFINRRSVNKEGIKEKAKRKNKQFLNPKFVNEQTTLL